MSKKASDYIPYAQDQGLPYLAGAGMAGTSIQRKTVVAAGATYTFTFLTEGLLNMADGTYQVLVQNNTTAGTGLAASKTATGFDITGVLASDSIDVVVVGTLADQQA